jgi:hypothetical protein
VDNIHISDLISRDGEISFCVANPEVCYQLKPGSLQAVHYEHIAAAAAAAAIKESVGLLGMEAESIRLSLL